MFSKLLETYREAFRGLPREIWFLSTVLLINRSGAMVLMFLPLYLTKQLHFSNLQIGFLIGGCYGVGSIAGAMIGGRLTSQFGPIRLQIFSQAYAAIGFLLLVTANDFVTIGIGLFFLSIISEMVRPATITATTLYCPESLHKRAMGLVRLAANLGTAIGGAIGGMLAEINYDLLFYVNAGTVTCATVATYLFFGLREPAKKERALAEQSTRSPLTDLRFLAFLSLMFLTALVFFQLLSTFPKYLNDDLSLGELELGLLMAINTLIIVAIEMFLLQLVRNLNVLRVVAVGSLLSCLGFGLLPFGSGFWYVAFTVVVWTMGEMLAMPLAAAYVAGRSSEANRGRYMGMFVTGYSAALVVGPIAGMAIFHWNHNAVWYIATGIGVVVFVGFWVLSLTESEPSPASRSIEVADANHPR